MIGDVIYCIKQEPVARNALGRNFRPFYVSPNLYSRLFQESRQEKEEGLFLIDCLAPFQGN
jgi:hypothetical protein